MSTRFSDAPTEAEVSAIECPLQRAAVITAFARRCGTLPAVLAHLRSLALREARKQWSAGAIARQVDMSRSRIFELTGPTGQE